jgi:molybdopterin synthase sulfur carrier subunit
MQVTVRLFARLRDIVGAPALVRSVTPDATIGTVWADLVADHPALADYEHAVSCAQNAAFARMTAPVADGDEVAFLPPVSGG